MNERPAGITALLASVLFAAGCAEPKPVNDIKPIEGSIAKGPRENKSIGRGHTRDRQDLVFVLSGAGVARADRSPEV